MPRLLLFTPCEKAIVSQSDNTASLISILQELVLQIPADAQVPENTTIPFHWYVCTLWQKQAEDEGKKYIQDLELYAPDGTMKATATAAIDTTGIGGRVFSRFLSFPVDKVGSCTLKLFLREEEGERKEIASFPINVRWST